MKDWHVYRFGDVAQLVNGRAYSQDELQASGRYRVIRIQNLNGGVHWYYSGLELEPERYCHAGDLLFAWSATFGPYRWNDEKAIFHYHIWNVKPIENLLDRDFAYYLLLRITEEIKAGAHGIAMLHFSKESMEQLEVTIPDTGVQRAIAASLKGQLIQADRARAAAEAQLRDISCLADAIILKSIQEGTTNSYPLSDVLREVKKGIGSTWANYPVHGATREGLAPAKEQPGKQAPKYKPAFPGTVLYNPMRILIGSIAYVDDDDEPGITSPDYVVLQGREGIVDSRWFYYWLRSPLGVQCINSLARGAVRERMLFNRLVQGEIELPSFPVQQRASLALKELKSMRRSVQRQLQDIYLLSGKLLAHAFED